MHMRGRKAGLEAARAAFYVGDIAERIVAHMHSEGGYSHARGPRQLSAVKSDHPYRAAGAISTCSPVGRGARGQPLYNPC